MVTTTCLVSLAKAGVTGGLGLGLLGGLLLLSRMLSWLLLLLLHRLLLRRLFLLVGLSINRRFSSSSSALSTAASSAALREFIARPCAKTMSVRLSSSLARRLTSALHADRWGKASSRYRSMAPRAAFSSCSRAPTARSNSSCCCRVSSSNASSPSSSPW